MRFASADVTSIKLDDESVTVYSPPQQQLDLKLRHAVGALSRDGMEHELLLAAAEHPTRRRSEVWQRVRVRCCGGIRREESGKNDASSDTLIILIEY